MAFSSELGREDGPVHAVAVLADGRVVTGLYDGRVLVWDPAILGGGPAELGRHDKDYAHGSGVEAVAVLAGGQMVTGGADRRVLVWDLLELAPCHSAELPGDYPLPWLRHLPAQPDQI